MSFPISRLQRMRSTAQRRLLVQEHHLHPSHFILPIFVHEDIQDPRPISSLPGVMQWPLHAVKQELDAALTVGIRQFILFGIPAHKDNLGKTAYDPEGIVQKAIRLIRSYAPDVFLAADCCLCEYTASGHCFVSHQNTLDADDTRTVLGKIAISYAEAGVDCVAPSGMVDGMVHSIRQALDVHHYTDTMIMSYAAKYASGFYGPFRDAADSTFKGTRTFHQMNPAQAQEALLEAQTDLEEGADMLIVKPATPYQDILYRISHSVSQPVVAYHVSGEYAALKLGAQHGIFDEASAFYETYLGLIRSGARAIISYAAKDFHTWTHH